MELDEEQVELYLQNNPDFFLRHNNIVENLKIITRNNRTINLHERQVQLLREKIANFEKKFSQILTNAKENELLQQKIQGWLIEILRHPKDKLLPLAIVNSLKQHFNLTQASLKLWQNTEEFIEQEYSQDINASDIAFINNLDKIYCAENKDFNITRWLPDGKSNKSLAILPLHFLHQSQASGVLIFGAKDEQRFNNQMSTDFLKIIAQLVSALLQFMQK